MGDINSCRKYWQCTVNGTVANASDDNGSALYCDRGLVFDAKNMSCVSADLVDGCHPPTDASGLTDSLSPTPLQPSPTSAR